MTTVVVVVVNESLDSKEQVRAVFLRLNVNVLIFYLFLKSFYPDVVHGAASAISMLNNKFVVDVVNGNGAELLQDALSK